MASISTAPFVAVLFASLLLAGCQGKTGGAENGLEENLPFTFLPQTDGTSRKVFYREKDGLAVVEQDIVLGAVPELQSAESSSRAVAGRFAAVNGVPERRWPDGLVPVLVDASLGGRGVGARVGVALARITQLTGIRFVPRVKEDDYLRFVRSGWAGSSVGKQGGAQPLYLADTSDETEIMHEVGHALGFWHEHSRADRDKHVQFHVENIAPASRIDFKQVVNDGKPLGPYDFHSLMHYGPFALSWNGKRTISRIDGGKSNDLGPRGTFSDGDLDALAELYSSAACAGSVGIRQVTARRDAAPTVLSVHDGTAGAVDVFVNEAAGKPTVLVLASVQPVRWNLSVDKKARIGRLVVVGPVTNDSLVGVPADVTPESVDPRLEDSRCAGTTSEPAATCELRWVTQAAWRQVGDDVGSSATCQRGDRIALPLRSVSVADKPAFPL